MQLTSILGAVAPLLSAVVARQFEIPAVEKAVQEALAAKGNYKAFTGSVAEPNSTAQNLIVHPNQKFPATSNFWMENVAHQGYAPFAQNGYTVFRNVKSYGAAGDGVHDDTAAITAAISDGNRCGRGCPSSTVTPAVVYFPAGTYLISSSIFDMYYTQFIGDPNAMPTIKGSSNFNGGYLIDSDPYFSPNLNWGSTNVFFRQIRNLQFDTTAIPAGNGMAAIHWPTAQATSVQNCIFNLNSQSGTVHTGIFTESGSAGFIGDLVFNGGKIGYSTGNQQYTVRNLTFNGCKTAISHYWDWSFTYRDLNINNCDTGIDITAGGSSGQQVGSIAVIDSRFSNVGTAIKTAWSTSSKPATAGSVILENVALSNVGTAVNNNGGTALGGGSNTISAWGQGHQYSSANSGPQTFSGGFSANNRPSSLTQGGSKWYSRPKPTYNNYPASSFVSARSSGAKGDGNTDDTNALQNAINSAASSGKILYVDHGYYRVTNTITIPPGAKIVGEAYPVILSSGSAFANQDSPRPVVKVGNSGQSGTVEWSDMIVSTQGAQAGAVLIEWNLASGSPSGLWDVHTRVGGFTGSNLQIRQCPTNSAANNPSCMGAHTMMHITSSASGLFMENNWLWTADHDIDDTNNGQVTVYTGRGLLVESSGPIWLSGTSVEHATLYQFQFNNAQNIFGGFLQTETPYYQPSPVAPGPWHVSGSDPDFSSSCNGQSGNCKDAWGLRVVNSKNIFIAGGGFYSFFNNYSTTCSNQDGSENCQTNMVDIENSSPISLYNLGTIGSTNMVVANGGKQVIAKYSDNANVFPQIIALMRL